MLSSIQLPKQLRSFLIEIGELTYFAGRFFKEAFKPPFEFKELLRQCYYMGNRSLLLVGLTGFIIGLVLTLQTRPTLMEFGAVSWMPSMVGISIVREIGPMITALVCAGRIGSGIGAELGSMRVTEQIDAMEVSGTNPFKYLVVTRILAVTFMLPLLVILGDAVALYGSFLIENLKGNVSFQLYFNQVLDALEFGDILPATIKTFFFGFAIGLVGCFKGYYCKKGTAGVGKAANSAVVFSSVLLFILDFIAVFVADIFYGIMIEQNKILNESIDERDENIVIEIRDLHKRFGDNKVLNGFNMVLNKGESLVIMGKSGSGKSVMIKCLVGLLEPNKGIISVMDKDILDLNHHDLDKVRSDIGFLFQGSALYDSMTVRENLEFPMRRHLEKFDSEMDSEALVLEALTNVGLAHTVDLMPSELSGGMKRRVALARTLILKPKIILYDEPTSGLDPITAKEIIILMQDIQKKYGTSSLIITHDVDCARVIADRMILLIDGVNYVSGTYKELSVLEDPKVKAFFKH